MLRCALFFSAQRALKKRARPNRKTPQRASMRGEQHTERRQDMFVFIAPHSSMRRAKTGRAASSGQAWRTSNTQGRVNKMRHGSKTSFYKEHVRRRHHVSFIIVMPSRLPALHFRAHFLGLISREVALQAFLREKKIVAIHFVFEKGASQIRAEPARIGRRPKRGPARRIGFADSRATAAYRLCR